jgi:hypothetical protein
MFCLLRCVSESGDAAAGADRANAEPSGAGDPDPDADAGADTGHEELDDDDLATLSAVATCLLGGGVL